MNDPILELLNVKKINGGVGKYKCYRFAKNDIGCIGIYQDKDKSNPYARENCCLFAYTYKDEQYHLIDMLRGQPNDKWNVGKYELFVTLMGAIEENV